jgi:hypothetical protein
MTHNGSLEESIAEYTGFYRLVKLVQRGLMYLMSRRRIATALIGEITFTDTKVSINTAMTKDRF